MHMYCIKMFIVSLQTRDWKRCHKDECGMLNVVWEVCPNQDTSFARLFVRYGLFINVGTIIILM